MDNIVKNHIYRNVFSFSHLMMLQHPCPYLACFFFFFNLVHTPPTPRTSEIPRRTAKYADAFAQSLKSLFDNSPAILADFQQSYLN